MPAAADSTPVNPKIPATTATIRKMNDHFNITTVLVNNESNKEKYMPTGSASSEGKCSFNLPNTGNKSTKNSVFNWH